MVSTDVSDGEEDWNVFQSKLSKLATVELKTRPKLEDLVSTHTSALEAAGDDSRLA